MNGVHDMGGMHGFGPIPIEEDEPVFHEEWEGRVYGLRVPFVGRFRYAIEKMDPTLYLSSSYYERWLHVKTENLFEQGMISRREYADKVAYFLGNPDAPMPRAEDPEAVRRSVAYTFAPKSHRHETDQAPAFQIGEAVRTKNFHPVGHTRLPRYVRDKRAVVVKYYGVQDFDDSTPTGEYDPPQPLYCVRFEAEELWGEAAEPNSAVYVDMWESYLLPAA